MPLSSYASYNKQLYYLLRTTSFQAARQAFSNVSVKQLSKRIAGPIDGNVYLILAPKARGRSTLLVAYLYLEAPAL